MRPDPSRSTQESSVSCGRRGPTSAPRESTSAKVKHWLPWFRLHLAERDWDEALKCADHFRKRDKITASYLTALVYLKKGDAARAAAEVEVLRQAYETRKSERELDWRPTVALEGGLEETVRWYRDHAAWVENIRTGAYRTYYAQQYSNR